MSLTTNQVSVGTAATVIYAPSTANPVHLHIHNVDNTDAVYLGGSDVTTSNGLVLQKLDDLEIILRPGNQIYAVSNKAGHIVSYLKQDY
jgi:hypothetical protein